MKNSALILTAGSLALNLGLAGVGWFELQPSLPAPGAKTAVAAVQPIMAPKSAPAVDAEVWPSLFSGDLSTFVGRMKSAGLPPEIIRAILSAQLLEMYAARRRALDPDAANRPFWRSRTTDPKITAALKQLGREEQAAARSQQKALRELLGAEPEADDPWSQIYQRRQFAGVAPDKVDQIRQLQRAYDEQRSEVNDSGTTTAADRVKLAALDRAQQAELAHLLTPTELVEYELRNSPAASELRDRLTAFSPSEEEFRALFPLERAFVQRFPESDGRLSAEDQRARDDAEELLDHDLKAALRPERAVDLERSSDYNYQQTVQLVARLELPPEAANQLYAMQQDLQQRSRALNLDRTLSTDQRTQQLASLAEEAKTKITGTLGPAGLEAYRQYGGEWLQQLQPRPAAGPR